MKENKITMYRVGKIENAYGDLNICCISDKYYFSICELYDSMTEWQEIPSSLFFALKEFSEFCEHKLFRYDEKQNKMVEV